MKNYIDLNSDEIVSCVISFNPLIHLFCMMVMLNIGNYPALWFAFVAMFFSGGMNYYKLLLKKNGIILQ